MAKNVEMKVEGKKLHLVIDLDAKGTPSSTGKTEVFASTQGNIEIPGYPGFKVGVNCFKPPAK